MNSASDPFARASKASVSKRGLVDLNEPPATGPGQPAHATGADSRAEVDIKEIMPAPLLPAVTVSKRRIMSIIEVQI